MNDELLTFYFYNDGLNDDERRQVEQAICSDSVVRARYESLSAELASLGNVDVEAVPSDMLQRWHDSIDRAARMERAAVSQPAPSHKWYWLGVGTAITAALVIGITIGTLMTGGQSRTPDPVLAHRTVPPATTESLQTPFTRSMKVYFRDSRESLADMPVDADVERILLVARIIEQNRMYVRAAEHNDSHDLARVLRAFEPILVQLAADDITPEDAENLRDKLAFQLDVMLTKLLRQSSKVETTT